MAKISFKPKPTTPKPEGAPPPLGKRPCPFCSGLIEICFTNHGTSLNHCCDCGHWFVKEDNNRIDEIIENKRMIGEL